MSKVLLNHPIPYHDESPGSLLLRATEYNGWKSSTALLIALNYRYSKRSTIKLETIFCDKEKWIDIWELFEKRDNAFLCKCYKRSSISKRSDVAFMKVIIPWEMLRLNSPAICPHCIAEDNYQKRIWDFKLITACSKHKVKLINSCPSCKKEIGWNRKKISFCSCGYNLEDSPTESIDTIGVGVIENFVKNKDERFISLLCQYADLYKELLKLLNEPIDEHLIATMSALSAEDDSYMRETLISYVTKYIETHALHPRVTLGCFLLSKNKRVINNINKILINFENCKMPSKKVIPTGNIDLRIVSAILGVNEYTSKLVLLNFKRNTIYDNENHRKEVSIKIVNELLNTLTINSDLEVQNVFPCPPIGSREKIFEMIPKFLSGEIKYSINNLTSKGLMGISVLRRPTEENSLKDSKYLSLLETAQICNVHYENIRFAVKCGALKRIDARKTKGTQIFINKDVAYNFDKRYIFSGALALIHNCNPRTIAEKLIASGITPISGPKIDGGLTYLFKREDLNDMNFKKINALRNYQTNTGRKKNHNSSNIDYSISFAAAASMLDISVQKVTQLIFRGELKEYHDTYRRKSLTHESFKRLFDVINDPNSKKLKDAAQSLGQTEREFTLRYISTNLVQRTDTGQGYFITEKEFNKAKAFNKKYVTSQEGGKLIGTNSSYLNSLKRINKIKIVKQIGQGNKKVGFFCRDEVLGLKLYL